MAESELSLNSPGYLLIELPAREYQLAWLGMLTGKQKEGSYPAMVSVNLSFSKEVDITSYTLCPSRHPGSDWKIVPFYGRLHSVMRLSY